MSISRNHSYQKTYDVISYRLVVIKLGSAVLWGLPRFSRGPRMVSLYPERLLSLAGLVGLLICIIVGICFPLTYISKRILLSYTVEPRFSNTIPSWS